MPKRPNSMEVDFTACDDLFLIQACWEVILSFMGDSEEEIQGKVMRALVYFCPLWNKILKND